MASSPTDTDVVNRVLANKTNYYAIFQVDRGATEEAIKSSYKRLALKCHPDKNRDPRASEAFKIVTKAHSVLTDKAKRAAYDRGGEDGVLHQESGGGAGGGGAGPRGYYYQQGQQQRRYRNEAEAFEDFIFQAFGGGRRPGAPGGHHGHQHHGARGGATHVEFDNNMGFLMFIPVLLFILIASMLQSSLFEAPSSGSSQGGYGSRRSQAVQPFRLAHTPSEGFVVPRVTSLRGFQDLRVEYFVRSDFDTLLMSGRVDLYNTELTVLRAKRDSLDRRCKAENLRAKPRGEKADSSRVCQDFRRYQRVP